MEVRASHILVKDEGLAKQLLELVKQGEDFAGLARKHSKCPSGGKGGDLGFFGRGRMVPAFDRFCFSGKKGDVGLTKTDFGWHVIKITDIRK